MTKRKNVLPYAPIGRLIHEATGKRVSQEAKQTAEQILDQLTERIVYKAKLLAEHAGRKTIRAKDITLAYNQIKEEF